MNVQINTIIALFCIIAGEILEKSLSQASLNQPDFVRSSNQY